MIDVLLSRSTLSVSMIMKRTPGSILSVSELIEPHLHTLVPYLINTLNDSKVRYCAFAD